MANRRVPTRVNTTVLATANGAIAAGVAVFHHSLKELVVTGVTYLVTLAPQLFLTVWERRQSDRTELELARMWYAYKRFEARLSAGRRKGSGRPGSGTDEEQL